VVDSSSSINQTVFSVNHAWRCAVELNEYQVLAMKTKKALGESFDLMHSVYGLCGEVGEYADAVKKHQVYGRPFDAENAIEEIGDIMWFVALAADCLGVDLNEIADRNIKKLAKRYPDRYSDLHAELRLDKA
jgi:NTP pyrophosphatase (non-canonical NTP hydrolase)